MTEGVISYYTSRGCEDTFKRLQGHIFYGDASNDKRGNIRAAT